MSLSDEQEADYLANPLGCPFCKGSDVEGGEVILDLGAARQVVTCACGARWEDLYTLTGINVLDEPGEATDES